MPLSEGEGSEVNAQIGHAPRVQAQGGLAGDGGGSGNDQVNIDGLQADYSGGNGGDVSIENGFIIGNITGEVERQVEIFAQAGHEKETIVTASIGHSTQMVAITRAGGDGGDLYSGDGNTDNDVEEYDSGSFTLVLQDLNQDDSHTYGDVDGDEADASDTDGYSDDGIGIVADGNDATDQDKEVLTATHALLNGVDGTHSTNGIDTDLDANSTEYYKSGINPDATVSGGDAGSSVEAALMVHDQDGDPQFIRVDRTAEADTIYVANTAQNRVEIANDGNLAINPADASTKTYSVNVDGDGAAEFVYSNDYSGVPNDIGDSSGHWTYNSNYDATIDGDKNFTYVDLNLDGNMDLVDFDQDGQFDVVDIDQNGVYDRIDGRVADSGTDAAGNANIIDYANATGIDFDASKTVGGWEVADLSHADGGRGGNASATVGYTQGDITVQTGHVNFADDQAYTGASATGVTDSLLVHTDVQDNIVATGGTEDTVISRIGHSAYQYVDTGGEYDDNKVGRTVFLTDTDVHAAAEGGDAGQHALNASGGNGGDGTSILGGTHYTQLTALNALVTFEIDHLVGDIYINTARSARDGTSGTIEGVLFDPDGNGTNDADESTANRVVVSSKVDNAKGENIGIAQIGHGAISIVGCDRGKWWRWPVRLRLRIGISPNRNRQWRARG